MSETNAALENAGKIEALADKLSECANEIHLRIMKAIRKRPAPGQPGRNELDQGIDHATAQSLFESELALRQRANRLYSDAAACVVPGLAVSQQNLIDLADEAKQAIAKITLVGDLINLAADLVALGAAAGNGQATAISKALKKLGQHSEAFKQHGGQT